MMPSIMLIEDDVRLAELVSRYLESSGFRVVIANLDRHVPSQVFELASGPRDSRSRIAWR